MRIGIPVTQNYFDWLGGLNYLRTLTGAVADHGSGALEPVLVLPSERPADALSGFDETIEANETRLLDVRTNPWAARTLAARATGTDMVFDRYLQSRDIGLLSHHAPLGPRASVPTLSWVPDVQHRRLPDLFGRREIAARERLLRRIDRHAEGVVVSSEAGRRDLAEAIPGVRGRVHVLPFVPDLETSPATAEIRAARQSYDIETPYLYLPNQLWTHKNHRVVVEALGILRRRGTPVTVVATGDTGDPRDPGLARELSTRAAALQVTEDFRVLGRVDYGVVKALMADAVAVVNPSLFEGWSTTVEESRALGKRTVLSDIDVHREQDPPGALYADPRDPDAFADALAEAWTGSDPAADQERQAAAAAAHTSRRRAFAHRYEEICAEVTR